MQGDIKTPSQSKPGESRRQPMRSLRLRGHTPDGARQRLVGSPNPPAPEEPTDIPTVRLDNENMTEPNQPKRRFGWWHQLSRRRQVLVAVLALVVLAGASGGFFLASHKQPAPIQRPAIIIKPIKPPAPTTVASPLTGVQVKPALTKRPVTAVMIENSLDARPQSGLQDAGVVFEAIAEGGITRFIALYQENTPQYVGPVRSVRPYFLDWAYPFHASIAHVGGSPQGLAEVRGDMRDIDQFFNPGYYWRISSRYAPHNMYTSFAKLDALNKAKHYTTSKFAPWPRKDEQKPAKPAVTSINLAISSYYYNVRYAYNAKTNSYLRYEGGQPHMEIVASGNHKQVQLHPKVVIAMIMPYGLMADYHHSRYGDTGSGRAYVFQDGGVTKGTWKKSSRASQLQLLDSAGQPIKLDAGQTWLTALAATNQLAYK